MTDTTGPKKTRKTKKATVRKAEVKPTPVEQEPSNRNSTRAVADIPAGEGYLGAYGSKNRKDPGVDNG